MTRVQRERFDDIEEYERLKDTYILNKEKLTDAKEDMLILQPDLDILYMTRVQRERFDDIEEYERLKDTYILNKEKLTDAKEDMLILHPLPRVNEISTDVDDDKRAVYFEQAKFGMYVRMALIMKLLGIKDPE